MQTNTEFSELSDDRTEYEETNKHLPNQTFKPSATFKPSVTIKPSATIKPVMLEVRNIENGDRQIPKSFQFSNTSKIKH